MFDDAKHDPLFDSVKELLPYCESALCTWR